MPGVLTLRQLWADTTEMLEAQHEARWVCEVATGLDGDDFAAALDVPLTPLMVAHHDSMIARLQAGEPLQYVLGRWGFRRLDLLVDRRVLIPRPETEQVAAVAIELAQRVQSSRLVADLGTGSGAIGLSMAAELPVDGTTVWITDASGDALDVARANLVGIGRAARNVRVGEGSWFEALPDGVVFDVIVSNPPYVALASPLLDERVEQWEPANALFSGRDGLDDIRFIVQNAPRHLEAGGWLVLEIGTDQGAAVRALFGSARFSEVEIRQDLAGHDRVAIGRTTR